MKTRSGLTYQINLDENISETQYYNRLAQGFRRWKEKVNQICFKNIQIGCDDLPDLDYYTSYVEGLTPSDMYNILIRNLYVDMLN